MKVAWALAAIILSVVVSVTATEKSVEAEATVKALPLIPVPTAISDGDTMKPVPLNLPTVNIHSSLQAGGLLGGSGSSSAESAFSESSASSIGAAFGGASASAMEAAFGGASGNLESHFGGLEEEGLMSQVEDKEELQKQGYSGSLLGTLPATFLLSHHGHFGPFYHNGYHFCMPNILAFHLLSKSSAAGGFANLVRFWPYHGAAHSKLTDYLYLNAMSKSLPSIVKQISLLKKKGLGL